MRRAAIFIVLQILLSVLTLKAQEQTEFLGLSLGIEPGQMVEQLIDKGLQAEDDYILSGRIAGLNVWLYLNNNKDSTHINSILLTTHEQQGRKQRDDYSALMKWMRKHYGEPTWEASVRSHPFARWYVGPDHDIVMIASATSAVEVWFYENHDMRNIDYYSILKYCERNPIEGIPYLTAQESITWKNSAPPVVKVKKKGRKVSAKKRRTKVKARAKKKSKKRRR